MRRTAQLLRSLLSILLITAGEGIQFLWLAVSSRAELSAEVLFLRKQLAFYRERSLPKTRSWQKKGEVKQLRKAHPSVARSVIASPAAKTATCQLLGVADRVGVSRQHLL